MDVVKEVRQTFLDINSSKFAAPHHRVNHGGILCRIVVLAEEIVLTRLCWQYNNVGIVRYVIVSQRIGLLVHNMKFGILRQVLKWEEQYMIDTLFQIKRKVEAHMSAPLLMERESFLSKKQSEGNGLRSLSL